MEITPITIYLIGLLDQLNSLFCITSVLSLALLFIFTTCYVFSHIEKDSRVRTFKKATIINGVCSFVLISFSLLIPTQQTAAAMLIIPRIVNNKELKDCGSRFYNLAMKWMENATNQQETQNASH